MSTPPNPLAMLPLAQTPQQPLPPAVAQILAAAQQNAQQAPTAQQPAQNHFAPITQTPEYQAVQQAGQGSFGVPGYNAQGQQTPAVGFRDKLKRALSDAVFAIGEGLTYGPGAGIIAATPGGRARVQEERATEAEAQKAQQLQQLGLAQGRLYGGVARMGQAEAAQSRAQSYGQYVQELAPKFTAQVQNLGARTALANVQTQIAPQKLALSQLLGQVTAAYKSGMLGVEQNRTNIMQQAINIRESILPYQQAMLESISELNKQGQYDKAFDVMKSASDMTDLLNKVDTFTNQIMHPELINQAMQQLNGAVDAFRKLAPGMVQNVQQNVNPRAPAPAQAPTAGMVTMKGPKGTYRVPASQVPTFKKNGYSIQGSQ